jgi:hypothetical protein
MSELPYGSDVRTVELRTGQSPIGGAWPIVYGRCKVELPLVHLHLASAGQLECIGVVSLGEIDAIEKVYVGETEVYPSVQGWCQVELRTGSLWQSPPTILRHTAAKSALPGVAYVALSMDLAQAPVSGMPQVTAVVRGRKVGPGGAYTTNPVWFLKDLLESTDYGAGIVLKAPPGKTLDDLAGAVTTPAWWVWTTREPMIPWPERLRALLSAIGGRLYWLGEWRLVLDSQAQNVGTVSYDGPIRLLEEPAVESSLFRAPNRVTGTWLDQSTWAQKQLALERAEVATGLEAPRELHLGLLPLVNYQDCMRLLATALNRARRAAVTWALLTDGSGEVALPGTRVTLQHPRLGTREMIVLGHEITGWKRKLTCVEWSASDWDAGTYPDPQDPAGTTTSATEVVVLSDEFTGGGDGAGDGFLGELGWQYSGTGTVTYTSEPGHPGVAGWSTGSASLNSVALGAGADWSARAKIYFDSSNNSSITMGVDVTMGPGGTLKIGGETVATGAPTGWYDITWLSSSAGVLVTLVGPTGTVYQRMKQAGAGSPAISAGGTGLARVDYVQVAVGRA